MKPQPEQRIAAPQAEGAAQQGAWSKLVIELGPLIVFFAAVTTPPPTPAASWAPTVS